MTAQNREKQMRTQLSVHDAAASPHEAGAPSATGEFVDPTASYPRSERETATLPPHSDPAPQTGALPIANLPTMPREATQALPHTPQQLIVSPVRRWLALALLMLPVLLVSVDSNVLTFGIPALSAGLKASGLELLWMIDIYPLVLAGFLVPMGNLGDRIGRRKILLIGGTGFALVSVIAAFSPDARVLILLRALQAVFGAILMPATLSLIRNIFVDARERTTAVAIWASMFSAGAALGPIMGGWLLDHFWWGSLFLMAVPILIPLVALGPVLLPESKDPAPGPLDPVSILLVMGTLLPVAFGIKSLTTGTSPLLSVGAILGGIGIGIVFVHRQLGLPTPMLDVRLFRRRLFSAPLVINLLSLLSLVGFLYFLSQHLQIIKGMTPSASANFMLPGLIAMFVSGLAVVPFAHRFGKARMMVFGVLLNAAAYALLAVMVHTGELWPIMASFILLGLGVGSSETVSGDLALSAVPATKAGAASAISETAYEVGSVLGTAVLGGLLNAFYSAHVVVPRALSSEQVATATDTVAGAHDVASQLGPQTSSALMDSAARAFDSGATWTAGIASALALIAAVCVAYVLRPSALADAGSGEAAASTD